jgi:hypothetical protein
VTVSGTLADSSAVSQSAKLLGDGKWPFYVPLYAGKGVALGWLTVGTTNADTAEPTGGTVYWVKPALPTERYYPAGFTEARLATVDRYTPPAAGQNATGWRFADLHIGGGNLEGVAPEDGPMAQLEIKNNVVRVLNAGALTNLALTVSAVNGQVSGSFKDPVTGRATTFKAALVPVVVDGTNTVDGYGWYLGTNTGGWVWLTESANPPTEVLNTLDGQTADVVTELGSFKVSFGAGKFIQHSGGEIGLTGTYTYTKTSFSAARLALTVVSPPSAAGSLSVTVTFTSPTAGSWSSSGAGGTGSGMFSLSATPVLAPASLAGKTIAASGGQSFTFVNNSSFTGTDEGGATSGTYSYLKYTSDGGLLKLTYAGRGGSTASVTFVFQSATAGAYFGEYVQRPTPLPDPSLSGTFSVASP